MKYQTYTINKPYDSIYFFLKQNGFSENYIKNLRKTLGNFVVNDEVCTIRKQLNIGDTLKINSSPNNKTNIQSCILPLDVVFEDEYYLLINKPSGISCMPNRSHYTNNLAGAIMAYMQDKDLNFVVRIINRLDKDTAGIIIVAKDSISQKEIKNIAKTYYAICDGVIDKPLTIDKPIKTVTNNGINDRKRIIAPDGQSATTFAKPIQNNGKNTLVSLKLINGRTHQIRLHMSSIGHPLLGDELYGEKSDRLSHTALVCKEISFYHPYLQQELKFEIDLPDDFKKILP
ncbi:MAG: RluA family pseudouridine synthase [Clostridia bacterium]|nr:RluA family pseudouridine synthase [Clostridia bacterium]